MSGFTIAMMAYFIMQADMIVYILGFTSILVLAICVFCAINSTCAYDDDEAKILRDYAKKAAKVGIPLLIVWALFPSTKTAAVMVGSGIAYEGVQAVASSAVANKSVKLLEKQIDEALKSVDNTPAQQSK